MKGTHVSIDIEACGDVLLSIGACEFDPATGDPSNEFYVALSMREQMDKGLRMDADALAWWFGQSDAARRAVIENTQSPTDALAAFSAWFPRGAWTWAYPTSFDLPVIARVCQTFGVRPPWKWTQTMDGRTLWQMGCALDPSLKKIEENAAPELPHHALSDAKEQARWYARYLSAVVPHA